MTSSSTARKRRRPSSASEDGFTLVEMVIAIPVVFLILGLVFASIGVTVGLMGQVTTSAGAARTAGIAMEEITTARNCDELGAMVTKLSTPAADAKFAVSFAPYSCSEDAAFPLNIEVRESGVDKIRYAKTLTLAVM